MKSKLIKLILSLMMVSLYSFITPIKGNIVGKDEIQKRNKIQKVINDIQPCIKSDGSLKELVFNSELVWRELEQKRNSINTVPDKKTWFLEYKDFIEEYKNLLEPTETIYDYFTQDELNLLFCVVQAEIGDEYSFEQKVNVASVIFNRLNHNRFPDTLGEILVEDQFSTISNGRYRNVEVTDNTILACEYAFSIGDTTEGCLFFDSNNALKYKFSFNDGAHNFYLLSGGEE